MTDKFNPFFKGSIYYLKYFVAHFDKNYPPNLILSASR